MWKTRCRAGQLTTVGTSGLARVGLLVFTILTECGAHAEETLPPEANRPPAIQIVVEDALAKELNAHLPECFVIIPKSQLQSSNLLRDLAIGDSLVWIGTPAGLPAELWIGNFQPAKGPLAVVAAPNSPLPHESLPKVKAAVHSAFLLPPKEFAQHNIDEEIRAAFLPILEAHDRFGQLVGYPGIVLSHSAPALVSGRYEGAEWFCFFFDQPAEAMPAAAWKSLLNSIAIRHQSQLAVESCSASFASYQPGERVQLRARVRSSRATAAAIELRFLAQGPGQAEFTPVATIRRVATAHGATEAICDYLAPAQPGLWRFRVEICQDPEHAETLTIVGKPIVIDRREAGFVVTPKPLKTPTTMKISGPNFAFDGADGFWVGTHYYPSSSWWEWAWRDFDPVLAERDFRAMRSASNRLVRVWVDPVLDESSLRAMDAAIFLAAQQGIVLDFCLFNQWVQNLGFERPSGEQVAFEFRHPRDFNLYSISLRNLALQREYAGVLANRWRQADNVMYNLANETYVKDPDASQMDPEVVAWEGIPEAKGERRDTLLFRRWAAELTQAIRQAGGEQPVFGGYLFSLNAGGDNYLANADAPLVSWHAYAPPAQLASTLQYFDPTSSGRPLLLEEFGTAGWNNEEHYDGAAHRALAAGAAAAMSYEWGVSWLAKESCFVPLPIRQSLVENPDPRWFAPVIEYARVTTAAKGVGIAPFASGFGYGSIYHGTPFPAGAALALGRVGAMARNLAKAPFPELVYVVVPEARTADIPAYMATFEQLWREGIEFGVWQEAQIESLPQEARTLICPGTVSAKTKNHFEKLRATGAQVFDQPGQDWLTASVLPRVKVTPSGAVSTSMRRTKQGALYSFFADKPLAKASIATHQHEVELGLAPMGLLLEGPEGISMLEATGDVTIDNSLFCKVSSGRAILAAKTAPHLPDADLIEIMATEPTRIQFQRTIRLIEMFAEPQPSAVGVIAPPEPTKVLDIDSEMIRYRLRVHFSNE
jgi:hypothetical protein